MSEKELHCLKIHFLPVVTWMICERFRCISVAVVKPVGTSFVAFSWILSALASLIPLIASRAFLGAGEERNFINELNSE